MKNIGRHEFVERKPAGPEITPSLKGLQVKRASEYLWLVSLPIAGAILREVEGNVKIVETNRLFDELASTMMREPDFDFASFGERLRAMVEEGCDTHFECWRAEGGVTHRALDITIARCAGQRDHFLLSLIDRTAEVTSVHNLRREMLSDSLTGFANRTGFEEAVDAAVANAPQGSEYAMILVDLSRFSQVNEMAGSLAGDELLITAARRLSSRVRNNEILCRLGANEFALFARIDSVERVEVLADRLAKAFDEPFRLSQLEIQVNCAVAGAIGQIGQNSAMDTLRQAQIALKRAKSTKLFELYAPGHEDIARQRFSMETDLRRALQRGELELHYQPLMDLGTGRINGFEALARWDHAERGLISPVEFIPVAEESGLIVPLGRWALEEAARTIQLWDERLGNHGDDDFKISVNMSAVQMFRDDVARAVEYAISGAGIDGRRLTLELTESAFIADPERAKKILDDLKSLDAHLAMDDFGTGYSNLAYLQKLPIDVLKIDRSFVSGMVADKDKRAIVRTVLSLARALGMKTTAEGIESEEISDILKRLGCSVGQGYYFARPLNAEAAYAFLEASNADSAS